MWNKEKIETQIASDQAFAKKVKQQEQLFDGFEAKKSDSFARLSQFGIVLSALSFLFGGVISGDDSCVLTICRIFPIHLNLRCSSVHEKSMSSFIIKKIAKSLVESMIRKLVPCQCQKTQYAVLHDEKKYPLML